MIFGRSRLYSFCGPSSIYFRMVIITGPNKLRYAVGLLILALQGTRMNTTVCFHSGTRHIVPKPAAVPPRSVVDRAQDVACPCPSGARILQGHPANRRCQGATAGAPITDIFVANFRRGIGGGSSSSSSNSSSGC